MEFNKVVQIGSFKVGVENPTFIIAEAGVNHNGRVDLAKELIDVAVEAKVDVVKFQTFKAGNVNTLTAPKSSYHLRTTPSDEKESWFELLKSQEISLEMHKELISYCEQKGIMFMSTPYDTESVDLLESLDVAAYKVASTDANNYPLLRYIAEKGRPVILSTAMCDLDEVRKGVEYIYETGLKDLILLHCTANYPCAVENTNLLAMKTLGREFGVTVGYSDHCTERINPIAAVALGAKVIEKHFTISKNLSGPDHQASLMPEELALMVKDIRNAEACLGDGVKRILPCEEENCGKLRKSLVARRDIPKGTVLTEDMLLVKRPGTGMKPDELYDVIGKRTTLDLTKDLLLSPEMLE